MDKSVKLTAKDAANLSVRVSGSCPTDLELALANLASGAHTVIETAELETLRASREPCCEKFDTCTESFCVPRELQSLRAKCEELEKFERLVCNAFKSKPPPMEALNIIDGLHDRVAELEKALRALCDSKSPLEWSPNTECAVAFANARAVIDSKNRASETRNG